MHVYTHAYSVSPCLMSYQGALMIVTVFVDSLADVAKDGSFSVWGRNLQLSAWCATAMKRTAEQMGHGHGPWPWHGHGHGMAMAMGMALPKMMSNM